VRLLPAVLALLVLLPGCLSSSEEPPAAPSAQPDTTTDDASLRPLTQQFTGTATATPAQPYTKEFPFAVPSGAVGVNGTLSWSVPAARMGLELVDPDGKVVERGYQDAEGRLVVATVEPPMPGEWKYRVTSTVAVNVSFRLDAVAELIVPADNVDRQTRTVGAASFYEINLILEKDAGLNFTFSSTGPVAWDVHSHPKSGVKYWHQGRGTEAAQSFTAPERGVYSILFENEGAADVEVRYDVTGRFRLHSHSG
jgi:hypothetical protein